MKNNKLDLELVLKAEKFQQGFIEFLRHIESVNVIDSEIKEVIDYLIQNMQEEVAQWEEEKIESKVKDWRLIWRTPQHEPEFGSPIPIGSEEKSTIPPDVLSYKEKVKERLIYYSGDLKHVLLKILDDRPDLAYLVDKYMNHD